MVETQTGQSQDLEQKRNARRVRRGLVVSDKRDKTIKVEVTYVAKDRRYGKYLRKRTVLHVHDQRNEANAGDLVDVMESKPISKTKHWRLVCVVKRGA